MTLKLLFYWRNYNIVCHLSIISLKYSYLFKIVELEDIFKHKLIINLAILNSLKSFNEMVDK